MQESGFFFVLPHRRNQSHIKRWKHEEKYYIWRSWSMYQAAKQIILPSTTGQWDCHTIWHLHGDRQSRRLYYHALLSKSTGCTVSQSWISPYQHPQPSFLLLITGQQKWVGISICLSSSEMRSTWNWSKKSILISLLTFKSISTASNCSNHNFVTDVLFLSLTFLCHDKRLVVCATQSASFFPKLCCYYGTCLFWPAEDTIVLDFSLLFLPFADIMRW